MGLICMVLFSPYNTIMLITVICILVIIVYIFSFYMITYIKSSTEFQDNVVLLLLEKKIKKEEFEKDVQSTQNWDKKEKSTPGIVKDIQEYNKIKEKNKRNGLSLFTILFLPFFILGETDRFLKQNYYPSGMAKKKRKRRK